jgi:hypothetical protein
MFWNRRQELAALGELDDGGGLAVVWGRRRIGKTRLLLEWSERAGGVYTVADQSAPDLQRAYFARAISSAMRSTVDVCSSEMPGSRRGAPPRRCWSAKRRGSPVARSPR